MRRTLFILIMSLAAGAAPAFADKFVRSIQIAREEMNEVGGRACAGQSSAFSRLLIEAQGDDLFAGHAALNLAYLYSPSEPCAKAGFRHDFDTWHGYVQAAVETRTPVAKAYYGQILLEGRHGVTQDDSRGLMMLIRAVQAGSADAAMVLAINYFNGEHLRRNLESAESYVNIGLRYNPSPRIQETLLSYRAKIAAEKDTN